MRYWHPFSDETAQAVRDWQPDEVVLLPLYPHYSTTTTGSSLTAWREAAARAGLVADTVTVCCYPTDAGYVATTTALLRAEYDAARARLDPAVRLRVLFSAHGLPETSSVGRPVSMADRTDGRPRPGGMAWNRAGLGDLLSVACHAAAMD